MKLRRFQQNILIWGFLLPLFTACEFSFFHPPTLSPLEEGLVAYNSGNYSSAFTQFSILAEEGDDVAQLYLAGMYHFGQSVPPTPDLAAKWYKRSAAQGNPEAPYSLARMYELGPLEARDYSLAVKWYTEAARRGNTKAPYRLGILYALGRGVEQDFTQAYAWLDVAAVTGEEEAVKKRDGLLRRMDPEQISEAYQLSEQLYAKNYTGHQRQEAKAMNAF